MEQLSMLDVLCPPPVPEPYAEPDSCWERTDPCEIEVRGVHCPDCGATLVVVPPEQGPDIDEPAVSMSCQCGFEIGGDDEQQIRSACRTLRVWSAARRTGQGGGE